jgi:deazaflavin-dependent oxidoreductase (nitroreductase family)
VQAVKRSRIPFLVKVMNPLMQAVLRLGVPTGPAVLLTVRGRKSGRPHTTPVGVFERNGQRWLFAEFGHVNWVRNLRATPRAEIRRGRHRESIVALELSPPEAAAVLRDVVVPWLRSPRGRMAARMAAPSLLTHPLDAPVADFLKEAERYPVFEVKASPATALGT